MRVLHKFDNITIMKEKTFPKAFLKMKVIVSFWLYLKDKFWVVGDNGACLICDVFPGCISSLVKVRSSDQGRTHRIDELLLWVQNIHNTKLVFPIHIYVNYVIFHYISFIQYLAIGIQLLF